ncbi:hypothetical protein AUR04nite_32180 [Glutamicibacter uratoxydans]|uniref:AMIN-like domain-containing protein n=1 Tax=Glutamicibacter uratoxydans TaxID=43667 RepID=A0A4Y4DRY8_GLUUR|nr:hypothetical protein [Glutamicibacter uratoxydans]GED07686.1 hypothetical protein AUR04nite_32180 [Glutamicibacter uratoxydans]
MHRPKFALLAAAATAALLALTPGAAAAPTSLAATSTAASTCPTVAWGSLAKTKTLSTTSQIFNVRTGQHSCYDRMVIDLKAKPAGFSVKYVDTLRGIASGLPVRTTGGANLQILIHAPVSASYSPGATVKNLGYSTFKQQVWLGSFEGETMLGISTRARLPMRAFLLDGPGTGSRLVIDVAHHW